MTVTSADLIASARRIAEDVLFPAALRTDAADLAPAEQFDLLAEAGLYGLAGPAEAGGHDADLDTTCAVIEALAGGCLTTAFVHTQHHGVVRTVAASERAALREAWLPQLCSGYKRAGVALAVAAPGPPLLTARPVEGGWVLEGHAPWVTGWGRVDVVLTTARTEDGRVLRLLFDAVEGRGLRAQALRMVAVQASGTVRLRFAGYFLPDARLVSDEPFRDDAGGTYNPAGLRANGSLALV